MLCGVLYREDEMGTPYHIIVDEKTLETGILALQDRDTTAMVRERNTASNTGLFVYTHMHTGGYGWS